MAEMVEKKVVKPPSTYKSKVEEHFGFFYIDGIKTIDKQHVACQTCQAQLKYTGNTTNMHSHIVRHHPELPETQASSNVRKSNQPTLATVFCPPWVRLHSVVESNSFRELVWTLDAPYEMPSWNISLRRPYQHYAEMRTKVEDALKSSKRVALTCDRWTSRATASYATITDHFNAQDWGMHSYVLSNEGDA